MTKRKRIPGRSSAAHLIGPGPSTLNNWEKWRAEAGVRGASAKAITGVEDRGGALYNGRTHGYVWRLKDDPHYGRTCLACGIDLLEGECSIHPLTPDDVKGWGRVERKQDCWHVGCVTPEMWHLLLGPVRRGGSFRRETHAPLVNDKTVQAALDTPGFTFTPAERKAKPLGRPAAAILAETWPEQGTQRLVDALREAAGLAPAKRKTTGSS